MSSTAISSIVFVCVFGSALLGLLIRNLLPVDHLSGESKDILKLGTGLIATLSALVLGLLISSAKGVLDKTNAELTQQAADVMRLDRALAQYGPETKQIRETIKAFYGKVIEQLASSDPAERAKLDSPEAVRGVEALTASVRALTPKTDAQRAHQSRALEIFGDMFATRWMIVAQRQVAESTPLLVVMVFWLCVNFLSFGLFAPRNATVIVTLFMCSLSVSGAVFLIIEMNHPLDGIIRVSSGPMRQALAHLGQQ